MKYLLVIVATFGLLNFSASAKENRTIRNYKTQQGIASYYSVATNGGTHTASGKRLRNSDMTAAHRTLPFGTKVKVTNLKNGKHVILTVIDDGPHRRGRIIDVTVGAAEVLGFRKNGLAKVRVEVVKN